MRRRTVPETYTWSCRFSAVYLLLFACLLLPSCVIKHKIKYSFKESSPAGNDILFINAVLSVQNFQDVRQTKAKNTVLFNRGRETRLDGKIVCINSERSYEQGTVAHQIMTSVAQHLRHKRIFKSVVVGNRGRADYYLSGKLSYFYGKQDLSIGAAVGASFGLVGALATAGVKTQGEILISIEEAVVTDGSGRIVATLGTITESYIGEMPADGACHQIFHNVNNHLNEFGDKLAWHLTDAINNREAGRQRNSRASPSSRTRSYTPPRAKPNHPTYPRIPASAGNAGSLNSFDVMEGPCNPSCRSGYLCHSGRCVSPCNPPCESGDVCLRSGKCIPASTSSRRY
ncbi:MAG: hypothetical protein GY854_10915 [Deltaproteobacteria bacterium]|nr:hypothetical protein [Deltaproteobacteria bacterium]